MMCMSVRGAVRKQTKRTAAGRGICVCGLLATAVDFFLETLELDACTVSSSDEPMSRNFFLSLYLLAGSDIR